MKFLTPITTWLFATLCFVSVSVSSTAQAMYKGFNLTEYEGFQYDAAPDKKSDAQIAVDRVKALGVNHIELNIRAKMIGPNSNEIIPATPATDSANELKRIVRLMNYIHSQNMTVGLRPIFFVVGPSGEFPYIVKTEKGEKTWWHGNIQPSNPTNWFLSFQNYLDRYALAAKLGKADTFTIGAELYSMTVGVEDQWLEFPYGFPNNWLSLLRYFKNKLGSTTKIAYDINFTDDSNADVSGILKSGGELERWRYRLVDLADPQDSAEKQTWQDLVQFWKELDLVGIDMYRSLAYSTDAIPEDFDALVAHLMKRSDSYAQQLDTTLLEIGLTLDVEKEIVFKEIGFRSVDRAFIDPFNYTTAAGAYNEMHQAAGYKAIFESFMAKGFSWFKGINFWDIPIDPKAHGPNDLGFSPLDKPLTEQQIKNYFGAP